MQPSSVDWESSFSDDRWLQSDRVCDEFGSLVADILETLENIGAQGAWVDLRSEANKLLNS